MEERFGSAYARSVAADYRLPQLGATVDEALARGEDVRDTAWIAAALDAGGVTRLHVDRGADAEQLVRRAVLTGAAISVVDPLPRWRERGAAGAVAELR